MPWAFRACSPRRCTSCSSASCAGSRSSFLRRLKIKLSIKFSSKYLWHLLHLPASFYAQRFAGEIANRSQINTKLADLLSGRLATTAIDVTMMGFYAALMFYYDVILTLIGIGFAIINAFVLKVISQKRVETNMRVLTEYGKAQGTGMAGLQSIETIKAGGLESGFFGVWAGYYAKAAVARQDLEMSNQWLDITPTLLTALTSAAILCFGGLRVMHGEISIGMLVAFQSLMASFLAPINELLSLGGTFQDMRGDLERVDDVLDNDTMPTPEVDELVDENGERITRLKGYLELRDAVEQRRRFELVNRLRARHGLAPLPLDEAFLADLEDPGLPPCVGVALGLDRLVMLACGVDSLREIDPLA